MLLKKDNAEIQLPNGAVWVEAESLASLPLE